MFVPKMFQEAKKSKDGKASNSAWCNYDDLNEYFWFVWTYYESSSWKSMFYQIF